MDARIMKLDWPIPYTFDAVTTNIEAVFTEFLFAHYSAERTSLCSEVRGNITVGRKGREASLRLIYII